MVSGATTVALASGERFAAQTHRSRLSIGMQRGYSKAALVPSSIFAYGRAAAKRGWWWKFAKRVKFELRRGQTPGRPGVGLSRAATAALTLRVVGGQHFHWRRISTQAEPLAKGTFVRDRCQRRGAASDSPDFFNRPGWTDIAARGSMAQIEDVSLHWVNIAGTTKLVRRRLRNLPAALTLWASGDVTANCLSQTGVSSDCLRGCSFGAGPGSSD